MLPTVWYEIAKSELKTELAGVKNCTLTSNIYTERALHIQYTGSSIILLFHQCI